MFRGKWEIGNFAYIYISNFYKVSNLRKLYRDEKTENSIHTYIHTRLKKGNEEFFCV